ncbi:MAG: ribosome biogenesis factor YjgA [Xanthomonadaceae bacterium]|nr:ribosome biogenesis factor YjgA [Xanthomonadaceae bacterium]
MTDTTESDPLDDSSPSRSQQRREALAIFNLAERLVALKPADLERLPLPDDLREQIAETQAITSHIAHKRQLQFLAKHMRRTDERTLDTLRQLLDHDKGAARREAAELHAIERWRDRLLGEGDAALSDLLAEHPAADRQHLRQLMRQGHDERLHNKPPRAQRELFRALRELLGSG